VLKAHSSQLIITSHNITELLRKLILYILLVIAVASCKRNIVDPTVTADFTYTVVDNDFSVPVRIAFANTSSGAQNYKWTFPGGSLETYDKKEPGTITFNTPGKVTVKLEAWNNDLRSEKEIVIQLDSLVKANFDIKPVINNFGPTEFLITNNSLGAAKFSWVFENGTPATSAEKNPKVNYTNPGSYRIKLEVQNERGEKDTVSKSVTVLPALSKPAFDIEPSFDDDDFEAPFTATLQNHTTGATVHNWSAGGGVVNSAADSIPTVTYNLPGLYNIKYVATNGKQKDSITKTIQIKPNSGLRTIPNVKLGINTAHGAIGSFFSTKLRRVFKKDEVNTTSGNSIDLVYFGLSESFSFNLFVSPDSAATLTFDAIPNASATKIINKQEGCGCGTSFSVTQFDNAVTGSALQALAINVTPAGSSNFNNAVVPRIILFENAAGKKGAVKIKQYVNAGQQSYIICDIKVQKD
jgi:PKD repeat protein